MPLAEKGVARAIASLFPGSSCPGIIRIILCFVTVLGGIGPLLDNGAGEGIRTLLYDIEPLDFLALGVPAAGFQGLIVIVGAVAAYKATRVSLVLKSD